MLFVVIVSEFGYDLKKTIMWGANFKNYHNFQSFHYFLLYLVRRCKLKKHILVRLNLGNTTACEEMLH